MTRMRTASNVLGLSALVLSASAPAQAQVSSSSPGGDPPKATLFAGFSRLQVEGGGWNGWQAEAEWALGDRLSLVVDGSGHSRSEGGADLSQLSGVVGARLSLRRSSSRAFVHALGGVARNSGGLTVFDVSIRETATDLALAAGGGASLGLGSRFGLRIGADWLAVRRDSGTQGDLRASLGVELNLGR